ncbi:MAG TPA: hypothetical protein ACFE0H_01370 [Elainellaceae cyanobacterium]
MDCPFCSGTLLRHISRNSVYWFCPKCWQEMPNLERFQASNLRWLNANARKGDRLT